MDATTEWHRLNEIATRYEPAMRVAVTRAFALGKRSSVYDRAIARIFTTVGDTTADLMGLEFNPVDPIYVDSINECLAAYDSATDIKKTRAEVRRILPVYMSGAERENRLALSDGLDPRTAVRIELARQSAGSNLRLAALVTMERLTAIQTRSNLIALTETNRAVNSALVALWRANQEVSKAVALVPTPENETLYGRDIPRSGKIPWNARKVWVTRRDERVCNYCDPLDGIRAKLTEDFVTDYGIIPVPPVHPRCRCFLIVTTEH